MGVLTLTEGLVDRERQSAEIEWGGGGRDSQREREREVLGVQALTEGLVGRKRLSKRERERCLGRSDSDTGCGGQRETVREGKGRERERYITVVFRH